MHVVYDERAGRHPKVLAPGDRTMRATGQGGGLSGCYRKPGCKFRKAPDRRYGVRKGLMAEGLPGVPGVPTALSSTSSILGSSRHRGSGRSHPSTRPYPPGPARSSAPTEIPVPGQPSRGLRLRRHRPLFRWQRHAHLRHHCRRSPGHKTLVLLPLGAVAGDISGSTSSSSTRPSPYFPKVSDGTRPVRQGETRGPASGHRTSIRRNRIYAMEKKTDGKTISAAKFCQIRLAASSGGSSEG